MRVHREPLLELGHFRHRVDEGAIPLAPLVAAVERVGQVESARGQRGMILSVHRLVGVLHRRNVVTHVHDGVGRKHVVRVEGKEVALRVAGRGRAELVLLLHVQVLGGRRRAGLRRVGAILD